MTENEIVTITADLKIPRQYKAFYDRLIELGADVGDLADIAAGGIIGYLNALSDEIQENGVSAIYPANPEILSREKLNKVMVSISG